MTTEANANDLVGALNAARATEFLPPVQPSDALNDIAGPWARTMANWRALEHSNNPDVSECVAEGYATAEACVAGWMADAPHRAIVLGNFDSVGVGMATDSNDVVYWCADFALEAKVWT